MDGRLVARLVQRRTEPTQRTAVEAEHPFGESALVVALAAARLVVPARLDVHLAISRRTASCLGVERTIQLGVEERVQHLGPDAERIHQPQTRRFLLIARALHHDVEQRVVVDQEGHRTTIQGIGGGRVEAKRPLVRRHRALGIRLEVTPSHGQVRGRVVGVRARFKGGTTQRLAAALSGERRREDRQGQQPARGQRGAAGHGRWSPSVQRSDGAVASAARRCSANARWRSARRARARKFEYSARASSLRSLASYSRPSSK